MGAEAEVLDANKRLLAAVGAGDWATYATLSTDDATCVEPETSGHVVSGLSFHKHFFDLGKTAPPPPAGTPPTNNVIASPHVRMLGPDHALVVYVRVTQSAGKVTTANETRLWKRVGGMWKNVHFHRSKL